MNQPWLTSSDCPVSAPLGNDDAVGSSCIGGAQNCTEIMRIFNSIQHHDKRIFATLGRNHIIKIHIRLRRRDRHHALIRSCTRHTIKFGARQKSHRDAGVPAVLNKLLQPQVVSFFGDSYPLEGATA